MIVTLSPARMDAGLSAIRAGNVLTLNGEPVDLALYDADGAPNPWIVGRPVRVGGVWHVTLILPHGPGAPQEALWPAPLALAGDGPLPLPGAQAGS